MPGERKKITKVWKAQWSLILPAILNKTKSHSSENKAKKDLLSQDLRLGPLRRRKTAAFLPNKLLCSHLKMSYWMNEWMNSLNWSISTGFCVIPSGSSPNYIPIYIHHYLESLLFHHQCPEDRRPEKDAVEEKPPAISPFYHFEDFSGLRFLHLRSVS